MSCVRVDDDDQTSRVPIVPSPIRRVMRTGPKSEPESGLRRAGSAMYRGSMGDSLGMGSGIGIYISLHFRDKRKEKISPYPSSKFGCVCLQWWLYTRLLGGREQTEP